MIGNERKSAIVVAAVLNRPTLVLNRNWQPIGVSTVGKSLVKVWNDAARIVDPANYQQYTWHDWAELMPASGDRFIQTCRLQLRVPEVIVLSNYDRVPTNAVTFSRRNVFKRDRFTCQYCGRRGGAIAKSQNESHHERSQSSAVQTDGSRLTREELTIDHVFPRSQGGTSTWENCVLACVTCNLRKANRTPQQAGMPLRKQPVRPQWKPLYAKHGVRIDSWSKFVSEAYWNAELEQS